MVSWCSGYRAARCANILEPAPLSPEKTGGWEVQIDWDYVRQEVGAKGTTITDRAGSGAGNQVRKILAGLLGVCQPAGLAQ
jgi:hypothetical protein